MKVWTELLLIVKSEPVRANTRFEPGFGGELLAQLSIADHQEDHAFAHMRRKTLHRGDERIRALAPNDLAGKEHGDVARSEPELRPHRLPELRAGPLVEREWTRVDAVNRK